MKFDWKKHIEEALNATKYCSIATVDKKGVWSNPVYFAWDKNYNFYFISQMKSRHMQNIKSNSRIAISIYKTEQKENVIGVQLEGTAKILSKNDGEKEINHAHDTYYGRAGFGPDMREYLKNPTWLGFDGQKSAAGNEQQGFGPISETQLGNHCP